jgi:hypothetical protein
MTLALNVALTLTGATLAFIAYRRYLLTDRLRGILHGIYLAIASALLLGLSLSLSAADMLFMTIVGYSLPFILLLYRKVLYGSARIYLDRESKNPSFEDKLHKSGLVGRILLKHRDEFRKNR